jgi:hypothetical protein
MDSSIFKKEEYNIWELKNENQLADFSSLELVSFIKSQRRWKTKAVSALDKLLRAIQKLSTQDDVPKLHSLKSTYDDILASKKTEPPKKAKAQKRNKSASHKELDPSQPLSPKSSKKVKTDKPEGKSTADKSPERDDPTSPTPKDSTLTPETDSKPKSTPSSKAKEAKKDKDATPKAESKKKEPKTEEKKDNTQKSLFTFFTKKPVQNPVSQPAEPTAAPAPVEKSFLRCLGSYPTISVWDSERERRFEGVFGEGSKPSVEYLLNEVKSKKKVSRIFKRKGLKGRKVFVVIHDGFRRVKGKFDIVSNRIGGRKPLGKDEVQIDYDVDSEEEWENQNADEIGDNDEEDETNEQEEEESEGFIVSDGYLSDTERRALLKDDDEVSQGKACNDSWKREGDVF